MTNFLAIDYGKRHVGLGWGSSDIGVAFPCKPILCGPGKDFWTALGNVVHGKKVEAFVLGWPISMDGGITPWTEEVGTFAGRLRKKFSLPIYLSDERLTSYQVKRDLEEMGLRAPYESHIRRRRSGVEDSCAAALFLQDFFNGGARSIF
ncbi:MAG: Holliday junction resolvase RuvX [Puniceicoccales bacterium]|jgi:putative Holliday junction resolvase|nr:Holliday junction resolvase RuvX [Puniceicoccales bacterium]